MNKRYSISFLVITLVLALLAGFLGSKIGAGNAPVTYNVQGGGNYSFLTDTSFKVPEGLNFLAAANFAKSSVVYINSKIQVKRGRSGQDDFFDDLPIPDSYRQGESSGSGVIISPDGYIITNNHVIDDASEIAVVTIDKRSFTGKVIGTDPLTDLALIKIEARGLPYMQIGNSDKLQVGEWVLAVGNPFDLTSTVTAGIVSAKSRFIRAINMPNEPGIESYIQTDAAVNPGNSGGALVNLKGELIGINTVIASNTGAFVGYSFAVPATIVIKVFNDLKKYGDVQRGLMGVNINEITANFAKEKRLPSIKGVYVGGVVPESGAEKAGLKLGDVILDVNGYEVNSANELVEYVSRFRPSDLVKVKFIRGGKTQIVSVQLRSRNGDLSSNGKGGGLSLPALGAVLIPLTTEELDNYDVRGGAKVSKVISGSPLAKAEVAEGFIILKMDKKPINKPTDVERLMKSTKSPYLIEGMYPDGSMAYYAIEIE